MCGEELTQTTEMDRTCIVLARLVLRFPTSTSTAASLNTTLFLTTPLHKQFWTAPGMFATAHRGLS